MPEVVRTPQDVLEASIASIEEATQAHQQAAEREKRLRNELRGAEDATRTTRAAAWELRMQATNQIHEVVTPETDPGDYLTAILSARYGSTTVGEQVKTALAPLREDLQAGTTPVAIVGAKGVGIMFGKSSGGIALERVNLEDKDEFAEPVTFESASGLRLGIPLVERFCFGLTSDLEYTDGAAWYVMSKTEDESPAWVKQSLGQLRVASTQGDIDSYNEMPHAPFDQYDTVMHHERAIKDRTGFVPVVAHGEVAVTGLLKAMYEGKNVATYSEELDRDYVIAAAVTLGLSPEAIAEASAEDIKLHLADRFAAKLSSDVASEIRSEVDRRKSHSAMLNMWHVVVSAAVQQYVEADERVLASIARRGIEGTFSRALEMLRNDHPDDKASFWLSDAGKPEHRLLESEAREIAIGLIATRYDIVIDPAQLESPLVTAQLAAQLKKKREDKATSERVERELRGRHLLR